MISKKDIINNLRLFTSDQIVEAIKAGEVTLYELSKSGNLTPLMRRRIEEKLASTVTDEEQISDETTEPDSTTDVQEDSYTKEDDSIEIPEASDDDFQSEITVAETPIVTAAAEPSISPSNQTSNADSSKTPSNKGMFKRPFSFEGRIRRMELWLSIPIFYLYAIIAGAILGLITNGNFNEGLVYIVLIPGYWFMWAQNCKRCHDRGNSGWYQIIPFYFLVLLFGEGEEGSNDYGNNPKE